MFGTYQFARKWIRTSDASAQTSELHTLAVIDKKVGVHTLVLDVIRRD
jgi:hypothetical protein